MTVVPGDRIALIVTEGCPWGTRLSDMTDRPFYMDGIGTQSFNALAEKP